QGCLGEEGAIDLTPVVSLDCPVTGNIFRAQRRGGRGRENRRAAAVSAVAPFMRAITRLSRELANPQLAKQTPIPLSKTIREEANEAFGPSSDRCSPLHGTWRGIQRTNG